MDNLGERIDVRIEVDEDAIVLVLPRRLDDHMVEWQEAMQLGQTIELAAADVPNPPQILNPMAVQQESEQVRLGVHKPNYHKALVVLLFNNTDRVRLSPAAAKIVAAAIKKTAQDVSLAQRDIHMVYGADRMLRKLINQKLGYTQHIR